MMEDEVNSYNADYMTGGNSSDIYSRVVRAGKRTYFFDVKTTRQNDYFVTITESKRQNDNMGNFSFEKHKIFLYKEDFVKFLDELQNVINFVAAKLNINLQAERDTIEFDENLISEQPLPEYEDL